ncbi:repressor LexA [Candidatus Azambacteria bacterium RIFCSPHIGHO2_02_FULL_52_12]|uniref:LexA repressor n=1 Tax=Candidatus Azambacteria bacterium RIFCSPLOWO2_01_FULL_46_25 TaxID=1797298 RepID=A0A1F5BU00_9BACT|nr:MAG: repressor LexA [Candidatus Azambacteria bacterium RIFCSPHIGHO2_02_FULL_52_12]OGD34090.1 MAG: repressor LexA [Candidatus Azambacteria bacterium RIFCSPLOWO2_01_FULL_46_25]OGD36689.1 MAG: repressor LexA [Candidatus Azambacteria bacterium RIFCSPHIGHO2_01_FULL_51_74]
MLGKRKKQILDFVNSYVGKNGFAPSLEEIKKKTGLSSVSTVHHHLKDLEKQGYIKRHEGKPRSIEARDLTVTIPLRGYIAAGQPIEAIEVYETIDVPKNLLSGSGEHYALRVSGDSMIDEGIFDGDTVVVRKQNSVENGETAVALINDNEVTLKKIYKEKNRIRLQPANPKLRPFYFKEVIIQGKVVSTFRNFEEQEKKDTFKFNQFLCGDVLEMIKKTPDNSIHFAVTSPPYNVGKDYDNHNDKMNHQEYLDWLYKVWIETKRVLVDGGRFAINIAPTGIRDFVPIHHDYIEQMKKLGMKFRTEILWYKQTMLKRTAWGSFKSPSNPHIVPSWEYVLIFTKGDNRLDGDQRMADITKEEFMKFSDGFWKIQPETKRKGHPAPFPEDLIYRLMKFYSYKGNNVLDMFGGTGTVAAVAAKTGRNFIHIDISPQYCNVAKDRVNKILGK